MKKKILLINPNHLWYTEKDAYLSRGQMNLRKILPPLGIAYLASIIRDRNDVRIIEANALNLSMKETIEMARKYCPDIVGITSFYTTKISVKNLVKGLRKNKVNSTFVVGGADPTAEPLNYIEDFDIVAVGEGEETFKEIVEGKMLKDIRGVYYKEDNKIINTGRRKQIQDLDNVPFPAWDLLPISKYKPETMCIKYKLPLGMIVASRGCPYRCSYCAACLIFPKVSVRSVENVFKEIKELYHKHNIKSVIFMDSTFTMDRKKVRKLCDLLIRHNIKIRWSMETRPDDVDYDLLKKMKEAGCYYINYGVQTFKKEALLSVDRPVFFDTVKKATNIAKKLGIIIRLEFILGLPSETVESIRDMFEKTNKINPDFVSYYPLLILPKTKLANTNYKSSINHELLEKLAMEGYKKFYIRPRYLISRLKHIWNPVYAKRYFDCFVNFK